MENKNKKKFQWSLERDKSSLEIVDCSGTTHKFTIYEFSFSVLRDYISEFYEYSMHVLDDDGKPIPTDNNKYKIKEFITVLDDTWEILVKYLVKATKDRKDEAFFMGMDLTGNMRGQLAEALHDVNHLDAILMSGGNLSALPTIFQQQRMIAQEVAAQLALMNQPTSNSSELTPQANQTTS